MREAGVFVRHADGPLTIDSPIWLEGEAKVTPRRAPEIGEHSAEVLAQFGYDEGEIATLRDAGAFGALDQT